MISLKTIKQALVKKYLYHINKDDNDLERLRARIEIVREGILTSPSDQTLEKGLELIVNDVTGLLFKDGEFNSVSEKELSVVTTLCNSLVEISGFTSKHNRGIYFSSQRYLFNISFYLFSHPNYKELFNFKWRMRDVGRVDITEILYDLAERQNMSPRPTGDVTAEGEFCRNIFDAIYYKSESIGFNRDGLDDAFTLWKNICHSSAKINPSRLKALYENLRDSATHYHVDDIERPCIHPEPPWFQDWLSLFLNLKPSIYSYQDYQNAYNSLNGMPASGEWAKFSVETIRPEEQQLSSWQLEDLQASCIQSTALKSIGYLFGVIAVYGRWGELKECWYSSQPSDASVSYLSHGFFNRNLSKFCRWMIDNISGQDAIFFVGRHSLNKNIFKTCLIILAEELNSNTASILPMHSKSLIEIPKAITVVEGLLLNLDLIEDESVIKAFEWKVSSTDLRDKVEQVLKNTLDILDSNLNDALLACTPDNNDSEDLALKYQAWDKTNKDFIKQLDISSWEGQVISNNSLAEMTHLKVERNNVGASYYLSKKSGRPLFGMHFGGRQLAIKLQQRIGVELQFSARNYEDIPLKNDGKVFVSNKDIDENGYGKIIKSLGRKTRIIKGDFTHSFIAIAGSVELKIYQWPDMPWSSDENPVAIYGFLNIDERIKSNSSIYYKLNIINPLGIKKLDFSAISEGTH